MTDLLLNSLVLFRNTRVPKDKRLFFENKGYFIYDLREGDGDIATAEKFVKVNYGGTILTTVSLFDSKETDHYPLSQEEIEEIFTLSSDRQEDQQEMTDEYAIYSVSHAYQNIKLSSSSEIHFGDVNVDGENLSFCIYLSKTNETVEFTLAHFSSEEELMQSLVDLYMLSKKDSFVFMQLAKDFSSYLNLL